MTDSLPLLIFAGVASVITFLCTRQVILKNMSTLPAPDVLAAAVAGLAFLGLTTHQPEPLGPLLIGYAALAICMTLGVILDGIVTRVKRFQEDRQIRRIRTSIVLQKFSLGRPPSVSPRQRKSQAVRFPPTAGGGSVGTVGSGRGGAIYLRENSGSVKQGENTPNQRVHRRRREDG